MKIYGDGVSPGIAIGKVVIKKSFEYEITNKTIENIEHELKEFEKVVKICLEDTEKMYKKTMKNLSEKEAQIFNAHKLILKDPEFIGEIKKQIEETKKNAAYVIETVSNEFIEIFNNMDNEYLKERALDIKDIKMRLLKIIFNYKDISNNNIQNQIIIANELTPSDTSKLNLKYVKGFITETGGKTSHTAIMAKSLEIPAIVGAKNILENVKLNDTIIFDGETGKIIINPTIDKLNQYEKKKKEYEALKEALKKYKGKKTITLDGKKIELSANVGTLADVDKAIENDAEGIGLFRTEFLYMNSNHFPTEKEQFNIYKKVAEKMNDKPVIIRTLDIGGDKELNYYDFPKEMNPFLGYRAIRFCLDQKELFVIQLRAILKASIYGRIRLMFPMISSVEELLKAKEILKEVKETLDKEGIDYDKNMEIGMMIEVPSAAIISDLLINHVDFFSIGTNDLIQYTVAVDRMNENIKELYSPYNQGVLRLIKLVIDNAHLKDKWVGMCGEVAGDQNLIPLLLKMGLDEFSMSSINILKSRSLINNLNYKEELVTIKKILELETQNEIKERIKQLN